MLGCLVVCHMYKDMIISTTVAGFRCGDHENPPDFFLDVLISHEEAAVGEEGVVLTNMGESADHHVRLL